MSRTVRVEEGEVVIPRNLLALAVTIAMEAPLRQNRYSYAARIPWDTVQRLRLELDAVGIDWKKGHRTIRRPREEVNLDVQSGG